MGDKSKIEWTEATWNPVRGCRRKSEGCRNCYAERQAIRIAGYKGIVESSSNGPRWTGEVAMAPRHILEAPLRWSKPRMVFVNSMSDLFYGRPFEEICAVFGIMMASPQHTFQVLTKYPERMLEWFAWLDKESKEGSTAKLFPMDPPGWRQRHLLCAAAHNLLGYRPLKGRALGNEWPLPNVWLGVSVEDQAAADERIPLLLQCPAAVRWVSAEPLLGPVDLARWLPRRLECPECQHVGGSYGARVRYCGVCAGDCGRDVLVTELPALNWIVVGGESGPGARPMEPAWARSLRDQCQDAGATFFFKQWGAHNAEGQRVGKKASGRELDGVLWDQFPFRAKGGV